MAAYEKIGEISVAKALHDFVRDEALPGTGIGADQFWRGLAGLIQEFAPRIRDQLRVRDELQEKIDEYHDTTGTMPFNPAGYAKFLREIGYIVPEPPDFTIRTVNVLEIARVAGPQLVVPASNARYALNAANARWGSLYDALYGTDAIPETDGAERGKGYNKVRGAKVIDWVRAFLDDVVPLAKGSHKAVTAYKVSAANSSRPSKMDETPICVILAGSPDIGRNRSTPLSFFCATMACISRSKSIKTASSEPKARLASPM